MHTGRRMCYVHRGWYTVDGKLCLCSDIKRVRCLATNRCVNVRGVSQGIIWLERLGPRKSHCEPQYGLLCVALSVGVQCGWRFTNTNTHTHGHSGRYILYTNTDTYILMRLIIIIYNQPFLSLWLTIDYKACTVFMHYSDSTNLSWVKATKQVRMSCQRCQGLQMLSKCDIFEASGSFSIGKKY